MIFDAGQHYYVSGPLYQYFIVTSLYGFSPNIHTTDKHVNRFVSVKLIIWRTEIVGSLHYFQVSCNNCDCDRKQILDKLRRGPNILKKKWVMSHRRHEKYKQATFTTFIHE